MKVITRGATGLWPEDWGTGRIAVGEEDQSVLANEGGAWVAVTADGDTFIGAVGDEREDAVQLV